MAKLALMLTDGFAEWEYALIGGVGKPFYGLDVQYFAPEAGELCSQGGLRAQISQDFATLLEWQPTALVVVGGMIWESDNAPDVSTLLKAAYESGASVGGICGGTLALARAGLLDDVAHTSNDKSFLKKNAVCYRGEAHYRASPSAVSSDRVITAPGAAPASFAAAIFTAAGLPRDVVSQFEEMMAAEHGKHA
ncbi:DJ-1/PfpI family protein [Polycladidibacter hongkongensis]|uniref:DJ-1/PfpI family protein n=1 Tax=Polycladidibacter hongkongensis TaxID=1647556 RepID=UPI00082B990D|nr:DJ-1/PfpI family protein [Pseudovibrio hongkongensis]